MPNKTKHRISNVCWSLCTYAPHSKQYKHVCGLLGRVVVTLCFGKYIWFMYWWSLGFRHWQPNNQGAVSIRKTILLGMAIPMLKIRRPTGRLIFNMGIPIPGKTVFYIETGPSTKQQHIIPKSSLNPKLGTYCYVYRSIFRSWVCKQYVEIKSMFSLSNVNA